MQNVPAWLWPVAGWLTLAAAAWLFIGPWLRRHPGRACPRCRYDMTGVPSLTCPECGQTAKRESRLHRRPPARLRRCAALVLIAIAWVVANVPAAVDHGPVAIVPGWLLSRCAPSSGTTYDALLYRYGNAERATAMDKAPTALAERVSSALYVETWRRLRDGKLSASDAHRYLARALNNESEAIFSTKLPPAWPADRPFPIVSEDRIDVGSRLINKQPAVVTGWAAEYVPGKPLSTALKVMVGARRYEVPVAGTRMDFSIASDRFMAPLSSPAADAAVTGFLSPRIHVNRSHASLSLGRVWKRTYPTSDPYYGYFRVDIVVDGESIGAGEGGWAGQRELPFVVIWREGGEVRAALAPDRVVFKVHGDEKLAYFSYVQDWSHPREAWSGTVELKPVLERGDR